MPRPVVPEVTEVGAKWVRRAAQATEDYVRRVERTTKSQSANALAARALWVQQLAAAATQERWAKGLQRAGDEGWKSGVREKGGARFGPGVGASEAKFSSRMGGILSAIAGVDLPARGLPGSETNFSRSAALGRALNKLKGTFAR